jgi:hypothetical protein
LVTARYQVAAQHIDWPSLGKRIGGGVASRMGVCWLCMYQLQLAVVSARHQLTLIGMPWRKPRAVVIFVGNYRN